MGMGDGARQGARLFRLREPPNTGNAPRSRPWRQGHYRPNKGTTICRIPATTDTKRVGRGSAPYNTGRARERGGAQETPLASSR